MRMLIGANNDDTAERKREQQLSRLAAEGLFPFLSDGGDFVLEMSAALRYSFVNQFTRRHSPQGQKHHRCYGSQDVRV
jgi:hypothetical protein